jgi:hypothetical protein
MSYVETLTGATDFTRLSHSILPNITDQALVLGPVVLGKVCILLTDKPIKVKLNANTNTAIDVNKFLAIEGPVSSVYITTTDLANITFLIGG